MEEHSGGWSAVPNWLIRDSDLTAYELLVFIAILNRANAKGEAWPSLATIQREARASKDSVLRALRALQDKGIVTVLRRANEDGSSRSNLYRVTPYLQGSLTATGGSLTATPGSLTATGVVAHSDGGGRCERPEVDPIEVHPVEELLSVEEVRGATVDAAFERAWSSWPKKVGKKAAQQKFARAFKQRPTLADDITRYADAFTATGKDKQYIKALDAWINGERWNDELPTGPAPADRPLSAFERAKAELVNDINGGMYEPDRGEGAPRRSISA